jgi:hypothetical protein
LERRRRGAPRLWRLDGTPTGRAENTTGARRREGRPRCSPWVGDVGVAGVARVAAGRRCPRRRLTSCSGPAPLRTRTAPPPRPAPHEHVPPPQRRAGGGARRLPASPLLPQLPLSGGAALARGQNPKWVGSGGWLAQALHPLLNPRHREVKAKSRRCPPPAWTAWHPRRRRFTPPSLRAAQAVRRDRRRRASAGWLARWLGVKGGVGVRLTRGVHASAGVRGGEGRGCGAGLDGPNVGTGWAGRNARDR